MKKKLVRSISLLMAALMIISSSSISTLAETISTTEIAEDETAYEYEEVEPVYSETDDISSSDIIPEKEIKEEIETEEPDISENEEEIIETEEDVSENEIYDATELIYTGTVKVSYKDSKNKAVSKTFKNDDIVSAIELACANNGTITLASNVLFNKESAVWDFNSGIVTINLGSYSIMPGHEERAQQLINVNGANLTISGKNAKMTTEGSYLVKSTGNSTLTVDGVNFSGHGYAFLIERGTTFNMKSGSITAAQPVALLNRGAEAKPSTFNMYKGTINGKYVSIFAEEANVNIFGGTLNCVPEDLANDFYFHSGERMFSAIQVVDSKVNISGGTISCKTDSYITRRKGGIILRDSDIKISGGTISVEAYGNCFGILTISDKSSGSAAGSVTVTGGLVNVVQKDNTESCSGIILDFHELNMSGGSVTVKGNRIEGAVAFIDSAPRENSRISGGTIKCEGYEKKSVYVDPAEHSYGIYAADTWNGSIVMGKASISVTDANSTGIKLNGGTVYANGTQILVSYNGIARSNVIGVYLGTDSQFECKDSTMKVTSYIDNSANRVYTSAVGITNYRGESESTDVIVIVESSDITVSSEYYAAGINVHDAFVEVASSGFNISGSESVYGVDFKETEGSFIGLEIYDLNIDAEIKKTYESELKSTIADAFDARSGIYGISAKFSSGEYAIIKRSKINLHGGKKENALSLPASVLEIEGFGIAVQNGNGNLIEGNIVKCNTDLSIPCFTGTGIILKGAKGTVTVKDNSVNLIFSVQNEKKAGINVAGVSSEGKVEELKLSDNIVTVKNYLISATDDAVYGIKASYIKKFESSDNDVLVENIKDEVLTTGWSKAYGIYCESGNEVLSTGNKISVKNSGKYKDLYFMGSLYGLSTEEIEKISIKKAEISVTGYNYRNIYAVYLMNTYDIIIEDSDLQGFSSVSPSNAAEFIQAMAVSVCGSGDTARSVVVRNSMVKGTDYAVFGPASKDYYTFNVIDSTLESEINSVMIGTGRDLSKYILSGNVVLRNPKSMFYGRMKLDYLFVTDKGEILPVADLDSSGAKEITLYDPVFSSVEILAPNKVYQGLEDGKFSVEFVLRNQVPYTILSETVVWEINGKVVDSSAITKTSEDILVKNFDSLSFVSFGKNKIIWKADIAFEDGTKQHYEVSKDFNYYPTVTFCAYDSTYRVDPSLATNYSFPDGTKKKVTYVEKGKSVAIADIPTFTPPTGEKFSFTGWVDSYGRLLTGSTVINSSETYYALFEADGLTIRKLSPLTTYTSETINTVVKDVVYRPGEKIVLEDILPSSEYGIYYGQKLLTSADYKVTYKNNDKVTDSAKVTITGKGKYKGQISFTFNIVPYDFKSTLDRSSVVIFYKYTGKSISLKGIGKLNGFPKVSLKKGRDYKLEYSYSATGGGDFVPVSSMKNVGFYAVDIIGIGNYTGTYRYFKSVQVTEKTPIQECKVYGVTDLKYTGGACTFDEGKIVLKYKNKVVPSEYYSIVYYDNTTIGSASIEIRAKSTSPYVGYTTKKYFNIYGARLDNKSKDVRFEWVDDVQNFVYHNEGYRPAFKIYNTNGTEDTSDDTLLTAGTDYTYEFTGKDGSTPKAAGKVTLKITGKDKYSGTYTTNFTIKPVDLSKAYAMNAISTTDGKITLEGDGLGGSYDVIYNKESNKPTVKLVMGMGPGNSRFYFNQNDYSISYKNYSKAGKATMTITGKNNLKGSIKVNYNISKAKLSTGNGFKISANDVVVNSKPGKYATTVKVEWSGKVLSKGKDYDSKFTYTDIYGNKLTSKSKPKVGDVINVTIKGKGNFTGNLTAKYVIVKKTINSLKASTITKLYTGNSIMLSEKDLASMKIKIGKKTLVYNKDYVISGYKNNINIGTATVTITGIGDYSGSKDISFKISKITFKWWK